MTQCAAGTVLRMVADCKVLLTAPRLSAWVSLWPERPWEDSGGWAGLEDEDCVGHPQCGDSGPPWGQHLDLLSCMFVSPTFLAVCALGKNGEGGVPGCLPPGRSVEASLLPSAQRPEPPPCFPTSSTWRRSKASATAAG